MGKNGASWFSVIKGVFTPTSKHKPSYILNQPDGGKKNKGTRFVRGFPKRLFREPSSIEKILEEVDQHNLYFQNPSITTQPQPSSSSPKVLHSPPRVTASPPPTANSPPETTLSPIPPREIIIPQREIEQEPKPELELELDTKPEPESKPTSPTTANSPPQTTLSPISPRGIIIPKPKPEPKLELELEPELKPEPEPKPTSQHHRHLSASKIQAAYRHYKSKRSVTGRLVRLQGVVKGQNVKRQTINAMKQMQRLVRVQTQIHSRRIQMLDNQSVKPTSSDNNNNNLSEMGDWDDSVITKEERDARTKKKVDAVTNRERAMSYAYSHQKAKPESSNETDTRNSGYPPYPWWWTSLQRQPPPSHTTPTRLPLNNHIFTSTPSRPTPDQTSSPMSSRSVAPSRTRQQTTPSTTPPNRTITPQYPKPRTRGGYPMKDNDSSMSCPPFSVPNYMTPTISAKAKARPASNPRDRAGSPGTPGSVTSSSSKRRFSFPFAPKSNRWNKFKSAGSVGDLSVDSANSVPASLGRKPFNRFV